MMTYKKMAICWLCRILIPTFFLLTGFQINAEVKSSVYGKVIDGETGEPVEGVRVCLVRLNAWTKTDKNGKFIIYEVPPGQEKISFFPPSPYAYEKVENSGQPIMVEIGKNLYVLKKLKYGGVIEMEMLDPGTNSRVEGVYVNIKEISLNRQTLISDSYSDSNGKFILDRLAAGKYTVILRKDGYGMKILPGIEVQAKQTTSFKVLFDSTSPARVTGRVICQETGETLKDVLVSVDRIDQYGWSYSYTLEDGRYSMFDLEPGFYEITIFGLKEENGKKEEFPLIKKTHVSNNYPAVVNFTVDCTFEYERKKKE
ncbi:MAG: carboxypeptidase regulatory-like domain-containing protein [Candidatus Aminicenantes bacterium]|nr:MAG: carboxypeptidase regulatory-like domain-containing protein [Candidatus Aminicenantes bacterium]